MVCRIVALEEKALEEAFLKVAQEESKDLPITNTIESWLSEQEDVVRNPESIGSRSETASHVSCAHHCSCRKQHVMGTRMHHGQFGGRLPQTEFSF